VAEHASEIVARAFNAAFEGYLVRLAFTPQAFERRMRGENLDPQASSIYWRGSDPAGILLVARRGWTSRIAAMAVSPAFRGQGLGRRMLTMAIEEAGRRGDRRMLLEVLENNPTARSLYESCGFTVRRRLVGFTLPSGSAPPAGAADLADADPFRVARLLARDSIRDWPWNLSPQALAALTPPSRALAVADDAFAVVSETDAETIRVNALFVPAPRRRRGHGSRLLRALAGAFPTQAFAFTPLIPEGLADAWFLNGWARHPLAQLEMELALR
jgi:ribosomal protein S18 acetylase RimI-like enzyme